MFRFQALPVIANHRLWFRKRVGGDGHQALCDQDHTRGYSLSATGRVCWVAVSHWENCLSVPRM